MPLLLRTKKDKHIIEYREKWDEERQARTGKVLATFTVTPVTPSEMKAILKQHRLTEWDAPGKRAKKERFVDWDYLAVTHERIDRTIIDWDGVVSAETGDPLMCDRDNKISAFENNPEIINYIMEQADAIAEAEIEQKERSRKNSPAGRSGAQKGV